MTPLPPLDSQQLLVLIVQLLAVLAVGLALGRAAVRIGLPPIVGELLAGVLLGPSVLRRVAPGAYGWLFPDADQLHLLDAIGQLGVLLLVGIAGAHVDLGLLRTRAGTALRVSAGGLLVPLLFGVLLGYFAPASMVPATTERPVFALFLGVAMCVSAIPVIAKTLADMKLLHRDLGQLTLLAGLFDDAVGWFLLSVVSAMAALGLRAGHLAWSVVQLVGFLVGMLVLGRPLVRLALRRAARSPDRAPVIVTAVILVLAGAVITQLLHLEAVFGAFITGVLIGSPGVVDPARLAPLRTVVLSVLAPIFLATAGLRMDLSALLDGPVALAAAVVLTVAILGKFVGAYLGARASRLGHWEGLALGAAMNARGVVGMVVATVGLRLGVLDVASFTVVTLIAVITSVMAPPLLRLAMSRLEITEAEQVRLVEQEAWLDTGPAPALDRPG